MPTTRKNSPSLKAIAKWKKQSLEDIRLFSGSIREQPKHITVVRRLLEDIPRRAVAVHVPRLHVLHGGKAFHTAFGSWPANAPSFNVAGSTRSAT